MIQIEIHKTISHPNIVKLYEVIEAPDYGYTVLVLEYLEGVDLLDHVLSQPDQKMNQVAAVKIFAQLLSAVQYLHALGIAVSHLSSCHFYILFHRSHVSS